MEARFRYRPKYFYTHAFGLNFFQCRINDEVLGITPYYLETGKNELRYLRLGYNFNLNRTDINYYPKKGYEFDVSLTQNGIGILSNFSLTELYTEFSKYWQFKPKLLAASRFTSKFSSPNNQPYLLQYGLGYRENFIRGFQPYVIDGQYFTLLRNELKYQVFAFTAKLGKYMPLKEFETVPYAIYFKVLADFGYVGNQDLRYKNPLSNQLNSGYGLGIDIVSYYEAVIRFEFTLNSQQEFGFNIQMEKGI
jgi:hypothetical protein